MRMAFGLTQGVSHSEQRSTAAVKYVSRFIAFEGFQCVSIENINRAVVVYAFYETNQTAEGLVSFAKSDQQVSRYWIIR